MVPSGTTLNVIPTKYLTDILLNIGKDKKKAIERGVFMYLLLAYVGVAINMRDLGIFVLSS